MGISLKKIRGNYPANALSVNILHPESITFANIRTQLISALPNIRPQKA